ncbi:MAG: hypothetical protein SGPRY_012241 [Prymnesium sp.]
MSAAEIGLAHLSCSLRGADASCAPFPPPAPGEAGAGGAPPSLLQSALERATHDTMQRAVRAALDAIASQWRNPSLHIAWRFDPHARPPIDPPSTSTSTSHPTTPSASPVCAKLLAAYVELRAEWVGTHPASNHHSPHPPPHRSLGWQLGLVIHRGKLRPHYLGGESCALDVCSLFPPPSLDAVISCDATHAVSAFGSLVRNDPISDASQQSEQARLPVALQVKYLRYMRHTHLKRSAIATGSTSFLKASTKCHRYRYHLLSPGLQKKVLTLLENLEGHMSQGGVQPPWVHLSCVASTGGGGLAFLVEWSSQARGPRDVSSRELSQLPAYGELDKMRAVVGAAFG